MLSHPHLAVATVIVIVIVVAIGVVLLASNTTSSPASTTSLQDEAPPKTSHEASSSTTMRTGAATTTDTTPPTSTPRSSPEEKRAIYLFRIGNWSITITLAGQRGELAVTYVGEKPLEVRNPLLPLVAGLSLHLEYSNGEEKVVRRLGAYYQGEILLKPGNTSSISFNTGGGLERIRVEGRILGKIPVKILLAPVPSSPGKVTVTETVTGSPLTTTVSIGQTECSFTREAEYPEPRPSIMVRIEVGNETITGDQVLVLHIPLELSKPRIPLVFENNSTTPIIVWASYIEYTIVNATSTNMDKSLRLDYSLVYAVPTTTPSLPGQCPQKQPPGTIVVGKNDLIPPRAARSGPVLAVPESVLETLKEHGFTDAWLYIRMRIIYSPVKEVFRLEPGLGAGRFLEHIAEKYRAVSLYGKREVMAEYRVHVEITG